MTYKEHLQFGSANQFRQFVVVKLTSVSVAITSFMESLILAQDERWRRA